MGRKRSPLPDVPFCIMRVTKGLNSFTNHKEPYVYTRRVKWDKIPLYNFFVKVVSTFEGKKKGFFVCKFDYYFHTCITFWMHLISSSSPLPSSDPPPVEVTPVSVWRKNSDRLA